MEKVKRSCILVLFLLFVGTNLYASSLHLKLLEPFLGIKYRQYGTTNTDERYTIFTDLNSSFKKAGLGNNGFVFTAYKQLLGKTFGLEKVLGKKQLILDNNFSLDLAKSIASNHKYNVFEPFNAHDLSRWNFVFKQIKAKNIYLAIFSRGIKDEKIYFHLGIIIKDDNKNIWLYHANRKNGVSRIWLDFDRKMSSFRKEFGKNDVEILIFELDI